ncbi:MAG: hypothetical protein ABIU63_07410 [Chitinophagaceae bacterium]
MKKILAIVVACMYLGITSGLVLQIHYCMGEQVGSSVKFADASAEGHTCSNCGMQNGKSKCCHDEVKFLKLQDVHKQVTADYEFTAPVITLQPCNLIAPPATFQNESSAVCNNSPPDDDLHQPAIFLFHCIFRI